MSDADKELAREVRKTLARPLAEANTKAKELRAFLRKTYSNPMTATVALVAELKNLEEHGKRLGIDTPFIIDVLLRVTGLVDDDGDYESDLADAGMQTLDELLKKARNVP